MSDNLVLSPQEERVINKTVDRRGRERVYKILERNQFTIPFVDVERARWFTESMKQTEGELRLGQGSEKRSRKDHGLDYA